VISGISAENGAIALSSKRDASTTRIMTSEMMKGATSILKLPSVVLAPTDIIRATSHLKSGDRNRLVRYLVDDGLLNTGNYFAERTRKGGLKLRSGSAKQLPNDGDADSMAKFVRSLGKYGWTLDDFYHNLTKDGCCKCR
jgi:hypothetical protein